jgi:hexulose-6-phosphate isomerase
MRIGFMQGRLSPVIDGRIQAFPWSTWQEEFCTAHNIGFNLLEWTIDSKNYENNPLFTKREEISALQINCGIEIESLTNDHFMEMPPWQAKGNELNHNLSMLTSTMYELGIKILVIPLVDNSSILGDISKSNLVREIFLGKLSELQEKNVRVSFELDLKPSDAKDFINEFPSENFGINYDIGNSASLGYDPKEELGLYGSRIFNVHVKDRLIGGASVQLGHGAADFETIFEMLKELKYSGNYILQTARAQNEQHEKVLVDSRKFIEKYFRVLDAS